MTSSTQASATSVAVAASSIPGEFLVPDLVDAFVVDQPEFSVETTLTDSAGVFAALREGRAEVGFAGAEPDGADLEATVVAADEIVLAVPTGHDLAAQDTVAVSRLASEALVEREEGSGTRRSFVDALADRGTPLLASDWAVRDSNEELLDTVADGGRVGVVSAWALERHPRDGVTTVRVDGGPITRCLYLVVRADAEFGPAATTFVALARERAES